MGSIEAQFFPRPMSSRGALASARQSYEALLPSNNQIAHGLTIRLPLVLARDPSKSIPSDRCHIYWAPDSRLRWCELNCGHNNEFVVLRQSRVIKLVSRS